MRIFRKVVQRAVVVRIEGVNRPITHFVELGLDKRVQEISGRIEVPTKSRLRNRLDDGHIPIAFVACQQRLVVRNNLCKKADKEHESKQYRAVKTQAVGSKAQPSALQRWQ